MYEIRELDVVELLADLPEHGLVQGNRGVVHTVPEKTDGVHYTLEFYEDDELIIVALEPTTFRKVWDARTQRVIA